MASKRNLTTVVNSLGAVGVLTGVIYSWLSFALAASQPPFKGLNQSRFFAELETRHHLSSLLSNTVLEKSIFGNGPAFLAGYCIPLVISTTLFAAVILLIVRNSRSVDQMTADRLLLWSMGFALVAVPAFNVLTQDIWLSVVWGRMIDHGIDPFSAPFSDAFFHDLPLDGAPISATYGPIWIGIAGLLTALSFGSPLLAWFLLKIVLFASWIGCLWLVSDLTREAGPYRRCLAIAIAGWLPLCVHVAVAEGHNDAAMMVFVLLWAKMMRRPSAVPMLALAVSVLMKYVSGPMALVDAAYFLGRRRRGLPDYLRRVAPAVIFLAVTVAIVCIFGPFGTETASMAEWRFLEPAAVIRAITHLLNLDAKSGVLARGLAIAGVLLAAALFLVVACKAIMEVAFTNSDQDAVARAQLSVMAFLMFAVVGHVWPWFFLWCVPFAGLVPGFWLSRFVIGAACIAPFTIVHWWHFQIVDKFYGHDLPSLPMYGVAAVVSIMCRRTFLESLDFQKGECLEGLPRENF